jgi:hypothetical protein
LWIETDSKLVSLAFNSPSISPWQMNKWLNYLPKIQNIDFIISHIYREGNHGSDKLAWLGLSVNVFSWWNVSPTEITSDLACNRIGVPCYRFW